MNFINFKHYLSAAKLLQLFVPFVLAGYLKTMWILFCFSIEGTMAAISVVLFIIKFPFDFIEETFRWEIMGWTEETGDKDGFEEIVG